ncbi:MAG: hypothetical protein QG608_1866, partial [Actinomycetota bacterium]|nr:hypothetical protein [Actinomycetota bacterium]
SDTRWSGIMLSVRWLSGVDGDGGGERAMAEGTWSATVAAAVRLADLLATAQRAGQTTTESCERAVDLMVFLGIRPLTERGRAAFSVFEDADAALVRAADLWEQAVAAARAVDPDAGVSGGGGGQGSGGGAVLLPGMVGDRVAVSDRGGGPGVPEAGADTGSAVPAGPAGEGDVEGSEAGAGRIVLPFGWESKGQELVEGLPGTSTQIEGRGQEWGLTKVDLYRDLQGAGAVLVHVDRDSTTGYDPVNDPYWGRLVGPDGELLEGKVLPNLRDEFARPEGVYEPTEAEKSRSRLAGFTTGTVEQAVTGLLPGVVANLAGQVWGPAKEAATRKLAGRENDPAAPRKLVFSRAFGRMNMTQLELVRADFPRVAREDARRAQYGELERQAHHLGVSEQRLDAARAAVSKLPGYPRSPDVKYKKKRCLRAIQMHHREGRRLLAVDLLMGDRRDEE